MSSKQFLDIIKGRRSVYALKKESPIDDKKIQEIVTEALLHVPSSFNSQSNRIILLLKDEHDKLWEITKTVLKGVVPDDQWAKTEERLNLFQAGYGTVLFFEDRATVADFQDKYSIYAERFPGWATQSDGMAQLVAWTALEAEGLGANLQHYNPLIDNKVTAEWDVPKSWELTAQLVFGTPAAPAGEKTFLDTKERFKVFGA